MRETCDNGKQSMSTDRLIARLMPKGNQLPRWREGKYPGHEYGVYWNVNESGSEHGPCLQYIITHIGIRI